MPSTTNSSPLPAEARVPDGWRWAPWWVLAFVALWPLPGIAEGVLVLGALAAIARLLLSRFRGGSQLLSHEAWALTSVLFFAYWLPELVSAFDAVDRSRAFLEAAKDLRYLPFLWLVAAAVANPAGRRTTFAGLAVIVAIWTFDALLQTANGLHSPLFAALDSLKQSISGRPLCPPEQIQDTARLSGVLGPCNLKLGQVLASLSPFLLYLGGRRFGTAGWLAAAATAGLVIVLTGTRAAWLTFALALLFSGWRVLGWKKLVGVFAFGVIALATLAWLSAPLRERVLRTAEVVSAEQREVDQALAGRTRIWGAALCMAREHPFNGVGARNFRHAFAGCDPRAGEPAAWGDGPALHAHQIVLEVLSETGGFGLLMWLAGAALAWRAWRYAPPDARERARPAMLALAITVFPLNTHLAFYSTFWGGLTLMLAALYAGSLLARRVEGAGADGSGRGQATR